MASEATTTTNFPGMDITSTKLFRKFGKGDFITEVNNWRSVHVLAKPSKGPPSSLSPKDHQPCAIDKQPGRLTLRWNPNTNTGHHHRHHHPSTIRANGISSNTQCDRISCIIWCEVLDCSYCLFVVVVVFFSLSPEYHCPFCSSYPFFPRIHLFLPMGEANVLCQRWCCSAKHW